MSLIYILEDDDSVRELESYAIQGNGYNVCGFANPKQFYDALKKEKPDLIVADVMLPGEDGLSVTKKIRSNSEYKNIPIVLVTAKDSEIDAIRGFDNGADDYITKPFSVMIFLSRIKAVLRRFSDTDDRRDYVYKTITIDDKKHKVYSCSKEVELTFKEYEILKYLILNKGIAVTREQLLNKVWGYDSESETRTVDSHILTLRKKLGESGALIETIRHVGYKLGD
ncbi:MAG: response regulator transcription factor [Clostridiales bacterium]|nr:response regulator transcription factor [Clostridiales bacterium]